MTECYAHIRNETMRNASNLAGHIVEQSAKAKIKQRVKQIGRPYQ